MIKNPVVWIWFGFFLVLLGFVLPWLMVLQVLKSTLFLNSLAFMGTVGGLFLGTAGAAWYVKFRKPR